MTDEELIARLYYPWPKDGDPEEVTLTVWLELTAKAADRIEALTAKVKLMDDLDAINGEKIEALTAERDDFADQISELLPSVNREAVEQRQRADAAEAKLAKAEAALDKLATAQCFGSGEILGLRLPDTPMGREILARMDFARTTLAEIKGE